MKEQSGTAARFVIDPRAYKKNRVYIGCLSAWTLGMLIFTFGSFQSHFWPGTIFGGIILLVVVPSALADRNKKQTLMVSPEGLRICQEGRENAGYFIRRDKKLKLTLEHVDKADSIEAVSTLNLWEIDSGARYILGAWIDEESRRGIFDDLCMFLESNGFHVESRKDIYRT